MIAQFLRHAPFLVLIGALAAPAGAAIPRKTELELQKRAPESVEIEVTEATRREVKRGGSHRIEIVAKAKVLAVTRSAAGLEVGDIVDIRYSIPNIRKSPEAGAWPSTVRKGERYKAFLKVKDAASKRYDPAASSGSFERVKSDD